MTVRITFDEFSAPKILKDETSLLLDSRNMEDLPAIRQLENLIGLRGIKDFIKEIQAMILIRGQRLANNLAVEPLVLHMLFSGNPGSGKSTVARILAALFHEIGLLNKGHLVECERADLVGEYIGHTAQKTRDMVKKAVGGVLFIDEAYSLVRGGEKDFGKEAIDVLVKAMEDHKNEFILILAGYKLEMEEFLRANPGLRSRFPLHLDFPDYTTRELLLIADTFLKQRDYVFHPQARNAFRRIIEHKKNEHCYAGNARLVRNLIERSLRRQAVRLLGQNRSRALSREDLTLIVTQDLEEADSVSPIRIVPTANSPSL